MRLQSLFPDLEPVALTVRPVTPVELTPYGLIQFHQVLGDLRIPADWAATVQPDPLHSRFPGTGDGRAHWQLVARFTVPKEGRPPMDAEAVIGWTGVARPGTPWAVRTNQLSGGIAHTVTAQAAIDLVATTIERRPV